MALEDISDLILLILAAFSVPFYILFLLTILVNRRKEPFNSSFFTLCISLGIADIATLVHSYIFVKAPGWSWGHQFWVEYGFQGSFLPFYANSMLWGLSLAQHIGVLLIGINRFTAVAFSFRQEYIWSKRNIAFAIALQWIIPIIFVLPMTTTVFVYEYWHGPTGTIYSNNVNIEFCNEDYEEAYFIAAVLINLIVNATSCGMYIAVLITALRVSKKLRSINIGPLKGARDPTKTNDTSEFNSDDDPEPGSSRSQGNRNPPAHITVPVKGPRVELNGGGNFVHQEKARKKRNANIQKKKSIVAAAAMLSHKLKYNRELRLAVCGFLMFLSMLVYFIFLLGVVVGNFGFQFGYLWNIASDIVSYTSPYTLIIMSSQTRVALRKLLKCRRI